MANTNQRQDYLPSRIENQTDYFTITAGETPVRNVVSTSKDNDETETWSGWLKVEVPSERPCRITALVDDNGSFTINGVTTEIAEGTHGSRRYTPEQTVTLKPGYYFVTCRMQDLPPLNQSYPNVKHFQAFIKWDDGGHEVSQAVSQLYNITEKGRRDVTIHITSDVVGSFTGAKSYPYAQYREDGTILLYDVPIYRMWVKGRNSAGEYVEHAFKCLRFMPVLRKNEEIPTMKQLNMTSDKITNIDGSSGIYPEIYDSTYPVHSNNNSENGGIVLFDDYLIHDGPDDNDDLFGGAGCIEMYGQDGLSNLISTIMGLTGSDSSDRKTNLESIMNHQKLLVLIDSAETPRLVRNERLVFE